NSTYTCLRKYWQKALIDVNTVSGFEGLVKVDFTVKIGINKSIQLVILQSPSINSYSLKAGVKDIVLAVNYRPEIM
ncbi:20170_t:CDS:2, partial [Dentiscutata erythropus]